MSIFGALTTAVTGLSAQSAAFANISDNIANSQSVGFKGTDTAFTDYLTESTANINESGSVVATPQYANTVQGAITQSTDPLALAISGQGFFAVSAVTGQSATSLTPTFSQQAYFTRAGDFSVDKNGYIVNSEGYYLDAWPVDTATGVVNTTSLAPIKVPENTFEPVATSTVDLTANLPTTPATNPSSSQIDVYDALGNQQTITMNWTQNSANDWTVTFTSPNNAGGATIGSAEMQFGTTSGNPVAAGTLGNITNTTGNVVAGGYSAGGAATLTLSPDFGSGSQPIAFDLGNFGGTSGLTQYAGTSFDLIGSSQNGLPQGSYSSVSVNNAGNVVVSYSNGQTQTIAQVPITTFNAPDALQRQNGQAFTATQDSGTPLTNASGANGAGSLVTGSVEASNVDIATEFTKLIAAQEAYSANAKVVTTADQLSQTTINMKQ
jgi:flagellar hook protein FlgE